MRIRRVLVVAAMVTVTAFTGQASGQTTVTPGAFCSTQDATGVTVTGLAMVCTTTAADPDHLRWRQAGSATTTTVPTLVTVQVTATTAAATTVPASQADQLVLTPIQEPEEFEQPLVRTG
jgi:hypothetical protein